MKRKKILFIIVVLIVTLALPIYFAIFFELSRKAHPVFLSDLAPTKYYQEEGELRMDRTTDGNPLSVNGYIYSKGIGTHAYSVIEYLLDGRYRIFEGAVGLDDLVANSGAKIEALIYMDNDLIYRSGTLRGWIDPRYFYINIIGKKKLKLVMNDGGDGNKNDHGDWLRLRFLP